MKFILPPLGVKEWVGAEVNCELNLRLIREDLCYYPGCIDHLEGTSMQDVMAKFTGLKSPFDCPIRYRISSLSHSLGTSHSVTWNLSRRLGQPLIKKTRDLPGATPWARNANDNLFELSIGDDYRRKLTVFGSSPDEALARFGRLAPQLRLLARNVKLGAAD